MKIHKILFFVTESNSLAANIHGWFGSWDKIYNTRVRAILAMTQIYKIPLHVLLFASLSVDLSVCLFKVSDMNTLVDSL